MTDNRPLIQEAQRKTSKLNTNILTPKNIRFKLLKNQRQKEKLEGKQNHLHTEEQE